MGAPSSIGAVVGVVGICRRLIAPPATRLACSGWGTDRTTMPPALAADKEAAGTITPGESLAETLPGRPCGDGEAGALTPARHWLRNIFPIPRRCRYDPQRPFQFNLGLNILFGVASTVTVANLYYCQPLLIELASSFQVEYSQITKVPTLTQAGYATGLLLLTPLGDLVSRRPLVLLLVALCLAFTVGMATARSLSAFMALSYCVGVFTVTPQVLIPLAADLAPPERRAGAISIVLSGLLLGILMARVVAGVVAEYTTWRAVYFMSVGLQVAIGVILWATMPDYPSKSRGTDLTYWRILRSMGRYAVTEPVLVQCCLINLASSACFSSFWVTLTFLLSDIYHFSPLKIGLFGLVGILGVLAAPFVGRTIDRFDPWYGTLAGLLILLLSNAVEIGGGGLSVAAIVICCFGLDLGQQTQAVSNSSRIFAIEPAARARMNSVSIICSFLGQVMGTAAGTRVYLDYGWRAASGLNIAWLAWNFLVLCARGPRRPMGGAPGGPKLEAPPPPPPSEALATGPADRRGAFWKWKTGWGFQRGCALPDDEGKREKTAGG